MELRRNYRPDRSRAVLAAAMVLFGLRTATSQGVAVPVPVSVACSEWHETILAGVKAGRPAGADRSLSSPLARESDPACSGLILTNLAATAAISGRPRDAESFAERAIGLLEQSQVPNDRFLLRALQILAATRIEQGKIARARKVYERMLGVRTEEPADAALVHGIAGTLYQVVGKRREAEDEYLAAIRLWEAAGRGEMADAASVLTSLAILYVQERRLTHASQTLERALAIFQRAEGTVPMDRAKLLSVRAGVYFLQHDFYKAEQDAREAIAIADREPHVTAPYRADLLTAYARILRKSHRNREARSLETRAAALRHESGTGSVIDVSELGAAKTAR
jgi:tetratricopeptide (TPR) repeat protein